MQFMGFEGSLGGKTITGAPFTATFSAQTTQVLADGNRIQRSTNGNFARDGNGRTRQDLTLPAIGPWATSGKTPPHVVLINDPVASVHYALEPDKKIARKMPAPRSARKRKGRPSAFCPENQNGVTTTSLGTQTMDGCTVQGTRTTRTIAAGAIGNQFRSRYVVERWYSPDLQMNVMIKRSDPRTGQTVFQLTNIQREEPDASLFQVPSDYTVKQGPGGPKGFGRRKRGEVRRHRRRRIDIDPRSKSYTCGRTPTTLRPQALLLRIRSQRPRFPLIYFLDEAMTPNEKDIAEATRSRRFLAHFVWQDGPNAFYPDHTHAGLTAHIILDGEMTLHRRRQVGNVSRQPALRRAGGRHAFRTDGFAGLPLSRRRKIAHGFGQGAVEKFDHVQNFLAGSVNRGAGAKLQDAAGIRGDNRLRLGFLRVFHLQRQQFERCLCFGDVVNSRRPAALIRKRHFHKLHAGNRANQLARGFPHFLAVRQMAGILVCDAQRNFPQRRRQSQIRQKFRHVPHLTAKIVRACSLAGIVRRKKMRVFLQCRAAPGRIRDDRVEILGRETRRKLARASSLATSRTPACMGRAPQHTCPAGTTTSQPFACSTRIVARFKSLNVTCAMQPAKNATRARRGPCAGKRLSKLPEEKFRIDFWQELFAVLQTEQSAEFRCARASEASPERW